MFTKFREISYQVVIFRQFPSYFGKIWYLWYINISERFKICQFWYFGDTSYLYIAWIPYFRHSQGIRVARRVSLFWGVRTRYEELHAKDRLSCLEKSMRLPNWNLHTNSRLHITIEPFVCIPIFTSKCLCSVFFIFSAASQF